ncbi:MAG: amino acid adenylation domain-containing protein, partial [Flavobacterium micromati]|nr:amino acid adenylation domain-containing protein [Flavobacterium micromati]
IENTLPNLTKPDLFSEYAAKVHLLIQNKDYRQTEDYWLNIYRESIPKMKLPIDYNRPELRSYNCDRFDFTIDNNIINLLKQIEKNTGCTLTAIVLAAFEIFLAKITGQTDVVIGFPTAGNRRYGMMNMIGDFANLLPIRSKINTSKNFLEYLKLRNLQLLEAYKHNQVSFGHLLQKLAIARDPSRIPLVPVALTVDLNRDIEKEFLFNGLTYEFRINPRKYSSFEIRLHVCIVAKIPTFQCSYNTSLFKQETINKMMISFEETLQKLMSNQNSPLSEVLYGDFLNNYRILNNTETSYPAVSLTELLSNRTEISFNNTALQYKDTKISYRDLHIKVNQFAHYLESQGVKSGDYIAVSFPRTPELVYAILAIIQCGAAYLPLDHQYPIKRIEYMMEDSEAKFLLTSKSLSLSLPKCSNTILIDDAMQSLHHFPSTKLQTAVNPENILYLLYTSGSTGKPKGTKITNRNVVNLLYSMILEPGIIEKDRVPFISTISFDIASFELFFPLFIGATLVLIDHETSSDGILFNEMLEKEMISLIVATPTTYQMLLDAGWSKKLPIKIWCCGEPLPAKLAKELINRSDELWTLYGPTEVTIFSSCKHIKNEETIISIGGPIANMQYYIVDEQMNLLPPNAIGEIAIGGDGVGTGYLGRPELTAAKYIPNIFSNKKNAILYLSGDLGKLLPTNELMCLGRIDHQVKVRGHRIEIGEVELALTAIEGVKSAIVMAKNDSLIAFLTVNFQFADELVQIRLWRNELELHLPAFMIPNVFYILDKMPTTLNDKIDRKALLEYNATLENKGQYRAPRSKEEKIVASIWKESLNLEKIDIFSNFFELGGHSIKAVKVVMEVAKITGKQIPISALFQHSTIEKFAKLLSNDDEVLSDHLVLLQPKGSKTPLFIVHGAGLNILNFSDVLQYFDEDQPVYGFQGIGPNGYENWFESIESMAACYIDSLIKVNPQGPYAVAGFSFGGIVAFEMARQLKDQGKTVSVIALLDTYADSSYYYDSYAQKKLIRFYDKTRKWFDFLKEMITSWTSIKLHINSKKEYLLKKYFGLRDSMTDQELAALEKFIEANRHVEKLVDRYCLIPQFFEVELFRANDNMNYKLDPTHLGWKKAALNGVNIHNIAGNHLTIVAPPNDKIIARMLQEILIKKHENI